MSLEIALRSLAEALKDATSHKRQVARLVALSQQYETKAANEAQPQIHAVLAGMRDVIAVALPHATKAEPDIEALLANPGFLAYLEQLRQVLLETHQVALQFGYENTVAEVGSLEASFSLSNPHVSRAVDELGEAIRGIDDTTIGAIRRVIRAGVENGSTYEDMAQVLHDNYAFSEARARTIARTEASLAYARGAAAAFRDLDATHVYISDGEDFDQPCADVDGTMQTIEWYEDNPKQHPNCTRAAAPVPEDESE